MINKEIGEGTVGIASDAKYQTHYWPTGVLPFDWLLGGGLPAGRLTEIYGDFSSLKSLVALKAIASVQAEGGTVALVDSEHAFDQVWAEANGVNIDDLILIYTSSGEEAVAATEVLVRNQTDLVVWDSVAAMLPQAERDKSPMESKQPARLASMMSQAMRRLTAANSKTALLFINQTRVNVGITFGSPVAVPGGKAIPFYSSQRVRFVKAGKITSDVHTWDGEKEVKAKSVDGIKIKMTLEKSKLNKPHQESWFTYSLKDTEIDVPGWLLGKGLEMGIVTRPTKMKWEIPELENVSISGREKMRDFIDATPDIYDWLVQQVMGYELDNTEGEE